MGSAIGARHLLDLFTQEYLFCIRECGVRANSTLESGSHAFNSPVT